MKIKTILAAMAVVMAAGCAKEQGGEVSGQTAAPQILAEMAEQPATRTCIDSDALVAGENTAVLWMPGDQLGVFTSGSSNVLYTNDEQTENIPNASFSSDATVSGDVQYAYYPYDAANDGKAATALTGTIPAEQTMGQAIPADYKFGELKSIAANGGYKFKFHNMFSLVRFKIDATGTALEGKTLESVTMTVTRDGAAVPVTGDFTFSAVDGTYTEGTTSDELKTVWNQTLDGAVSSFATVFPEVQSGDKLTFTFKAEELTATLTVTSKADFAPEMYYTFPLTLANFSGLKVEKKITGTFTAATYNVDGLGLSAINSDGPGSSGTKNMSSKIASDTWDFMGFSEDFSFHDELVSNMSGFTFGTYRGDIENYISALFGTVYDTDGLGFATRNSTCSFANETIVQYTSSAGGVTQGANTCIKKGFRYYLVTLQDGIQVDVLITHMNTYGEGDRYNAQHAQLQQVAEYIVDNLKKNNRPIIFMGDTNLRYTRHDFETYFWSILRNANLTYADPWVTYQWAGVYPTYPSNSLMVSDATGTSSSDIICETTQKGEVVDKIIYINNPDAVVQINANNYLRDYDGYNGFGDHMPIVSQFSYTGTITVE